MDNIKDMKIKALEDQIKELQKAHRDLSAHYREFVKATVQCFKENAEE